MLVESPWRLVTPCMSGHLVSSVTGPSLKLLCGHSFICFHDNCYCEKGLVTKPVLSHLKHICINDCAACVLWSNLSHSKKEPFQYLQQSWTTIACLVKLPFCYVKIESLIDNFTVSKRILIKLNNYLYVMSGVHWVNGCPWKIVHKA